NAIVEGDPVVHLTQFDIANHVIQRLKNPFGGSAVRLRRVPRLIPGKVGAAVPAAIHEAMTRFAVGGNGTDANGAVVVTDIVRFFQDRGALGPRVFDTRVDVGYFQGNIDDGVAVGAMMIEDGTVRIDAAFKDEAHGAGLQHICDVIAVTGFRAAVGD